MQLTVRYFQDPRKKQLMAISQYSDGIEF